MSTEHAAMLTFDDYERYRATHETPYDRIGHHRLHLQLCVNEKGRDHIIQHIPPELSYLWLDNLISDIEDTLIGFDESRNLLDSGKYFYKSKFSLDVKITIELIHVCVRVVSYPPIQYQVEDEMHESYIENNLRKEEYLVEKEEAARDESAEDKAFKNMFANLPGLKSDDDDSEKG